MSRTAVALERVAIGVAALALSVGLIALLSGFFAGRDQAGVTGATTTVPGIAYHDLGHGRLAAGQASPEYDSNPPTSGAHHVAPVRREGVPLTDDQLLTALELGDIVIFYPPPKPPPDLAQAVRQAAPAFSPALAAQGQTVIVAPRPGTHGLLAVAWAHALDVPGAKDPSLRQFITVLLGRGATSPCC